MKSIVIGTAGHIDHGKSSLVQALTGKDPDRLPEEKRRGITIDLGFADLDLGDVRVGFVDVPGHERFVKNMLAGVHGIDAVMLVIAADEGVMPQTREHFDICRLLGVKTGLVLLTKSDLVEEELMTLVRAEAEELVAGSFLEGAPILTTSARSGAGLDEVRAAVKQIASAIPARISDRIARLPIDRAFTMKGFGAVVTGTLISGEIADGDELDLLPGELRVRARGVQVHGKAVRSAKSGERTAVNLAGIDIAAIERGMVLAAMNRLRPTQIIDAQLQVLSSAPRAIRTRARVRVHIGSAEVIARVRVLNLKGDIAPDETGFAQIRLESSVVALNGDRFILRSYSPAETIAGGLVLDPFAVKHRGRELAKTHERLRALVNEGDAGRFAIFVTTAGDHGLRLEDVTARTGWTDTRLSEAAMTARDEDSVVEANGVFIAKSNFEQLARETVEAVSLHHNREPLSRGLPRETLRERQFARTTPDVFRAVISHLEKDGSIVSDKDLVRSQDHSLELSPADAAIREKIAASYARAGFEAPALEQVFENAGIKAAAQAHGRKILQKLIDDGTIVRIQGDMFLHAEALETLKKVLHRYASEHEPDRLIDVVTFKNLAGVSRKYAIPFLEYFDSVRLTRRAGDKRVILK